MGKPAAGSLGRGWRLAAVVGVNLSLGVLVAPFLELGLRMLHAHFVASLALPVDPTVLRREAPLLAEVFVTGIFAAALTAWYVANRVLLADADGAVSRPAWAASLLLVLAPVWAPALGPILLDVLPWPE